MRSPLVRRTATAGALVLSLSALAACSSDAESTETSASSAAESEGPTESVEASPSPEPESGESTPADEAAAGEAVDKQDFVELFQGAFDQATTATITLETGGQFAVEGTGAIDFEAPLSMQMTMNIPQAPGPLKLILIDGVIYQGQAQGGGKFFAFDLDDPNSPFGSDFTEQLDPRAAFDAFEDGLQEVTFVGEKDGLSTYALTVDSAALLEGTGAEGAGGLPETVNYTMSIDDDGFFRRFSADLGAEAGTFEASYDNWGEPVDIKAPKQSQIAQLPGQ